MLWLWVAAALVSAALASLMVLRAALAARGAEQGAEAPALDFYRRQIAELDDLSDRGLLDESERRSVRAETGRRLLAAAAGADRPLRAARPGAILALAAAAPILALAIYLVVGTPEFADQPFAARLARWRAADPASLDAPEMAAILRQIAIERPKDPEPLAHLAVAELASEQPNEAIQALQRATALAPRRPDLWEMLGEAQMLTVGGAVGPDAAASFRRALALEPSAPAPQYYLGRARMDSGDVAGGLADWRSLLARIPPGDPRHAQLAAAIDKVQTAGRLEPEGPPAAAAGPEASAQIEAMVAQLAARLRASPDDPDGWVRLVRAYAVLGETDRLNAALATARARYAARPDVGALLAAAAQAPAAAAPAAMSPAAGPP
jgi:cytochrome c-type biogenesis protein CcmH